jgi:hypothetical protein
MTDRERMLGVVLLQTVQVETPAGPVTINASDFDPRVHRKAGAPEPAAAEPPAQAASATQGSEPEPAKAQAPDAPVALHAAVQAANADEAQKLVREVADVAALREAQAAESARPQPRITVLRAIGSRIEHLLEQAGSQTAVPPQA